MSVTRWGFSRGTGTAAHLPDIAWPVHGQSLSCHNVHLPAFVSSPHRQGRRQSRRPHHYTHQQTLTCTKATNSPSGQLGSCNFSVCHRCRIRLLCQAPHAVMLLPHHDTTHECHFVCKCDESSVMNYETDVYLSMSHHLPACCTWSTQTGWGTTWRLHHYHTLPHKSVAR